MERMITRTIQKKVYSVMFYNMETKESGISDFVLTEKVTDNEKALALLRKRYEGQTLKLAAIVDTKIEERRYALSEVEFLKYAHPIAKDEEVEEV